MTEESQPKFSKVSRAIAWVSGLSIVLLSLLFLIVAPLGGIALLLLGLFTLPPVRRVIKSKYDRSFSRGVVVGIVFFGFIIAIIITGLTIPDVDTGDSAQFSSSDAPVQRSGQEQAEATVRPPEPTPVPEPTARPTPTPEPTVHHVGERFVVGNRNKDPVAYRVTSYNHRQSVGEGYLTEDADGVFLLVTVEMTNVGQDTVIITDDIFTVVDSRGREYSSDSDATFAFAEDTVVIAEQLDPDVSKRFVLVFDVPENQRDPRLKIDPVGFWSTEDSHYVVLE